MEVMLNSQKAGKRSTSYATRVVHEIPLSCGMSYVGHMGHCVNNRVREHALVVKNKSGAHQSAHVTSCGCTLSFMQIRILGKSEIKVAREIWRPIT